MRPLADDEAHAQGSLGDQIRTALKRPATRPLHPLDRQTELDRESDRSLREKYARWFALILVVQLVAMNVILAFVGINVMKFDAVTLQIFMGGTFAEVFGIVFVITT